MSDSAREPVHTGRVTTFIHVRESTDFADASYLEVHHKAHMRSIGDIVRDTEICENRDIALMATQSSGF